MIQFHQAERRMSKLRLAIAGPAGTGKTYSALLIAFGMEAQSSKPKAQGARIALIDTERGSGDLYAHLGEYDVCSIAAPFEPEKYIAAIQAAEEAGYGVIIIDSLSHAWSGEGGILDIQGHIADRNGNSWTAWRKVTPRHNQLVEAMLQSPCHIIATMRSKMEYAQVAENGKTTVKKLGMEPIQRNGMEYEFTLFLDLDIGHLAMATKDRTTLFDGKFFKPSQETGQSLMAWLEEGRGEAESSPVPSARATGQAKLKAERAEGGGRRSEGKGQTTEDAPVEHPRGDPGSTGQGGQRTESHGAEGMAGSVEREGGSLPPTSNLQPDIASPSGGNGGGNGLRILFAKLGSYGISKDAYRAYCHQKYALPSMKDMTPAQREEQIKILNSLKNNDRLEEFKRILSERALTKALKESVADGLKQVPVEVQAEAPPTELTGNLETDPKEWIPPADPAPAPASEFNYF